jgi:uncharacterized protein (DUF488 family)
MQLLVPDPADAGKMYDAQTMFNKDFKNLTARERKMLKEAKQMRCALHVHSMFTQCSLNVHSMFTECSLNVHSMFTKCSLNEVRAAAIKLYCFAHRRLVYV